MSSLMVCREVTSLWYVWEAIGGAVVVTLTVDTRIKPLHCH